MPAEDEGRRTVAVWRSDWLPRSETFIAEAVAEGVTGFLAPEGDVAGLTACLGDLPDDPARAGAMGAAGRRRVVDHWDIRATTPALEAVYDQVVG